jgi:hypothetical protein
MDLRNLLISPGTRVFNRKGASNILNACRFIPLYRGSHTGFRCNVSFLMHHGSSISLEQKQKESSKLVIWRSGLRFVIWDIKSHEIKRYAHTAGTDLWYTIVFTREAPADGANSCKRHGYCPIKAKKCVLVPA